MSLGVPTVMNQKVKAAADKIFNLDRHKFIRLIKWIKEAEKSKYSAESIVKALDDFYSYAMTVKNWYGYLNKLIEKAEPKLTARANEAEHRARKEESREAARKLFE